MLLGKRPRPPMRRTTSSAEFAPAAAAAAAAVLFDVEAPEPSDQDAIGQRHLQPVETQREAAGEADWRATRYLGSMPSACGGVHGGSSSGDFAPFLRACGLCNRPLGPGRDTYMYRGDIAFCSLECRQQQMNLDEQKDKCSLPSMKDTPLAATCSNQSDSGGTIAAT